MRTSLVSLFAAGAALTLAAGTTTGIRAAVAADAAAPSAVGPVAVNPLAPTVTVPSIDWGRCKDKFLRQAGARCGFLTVPMDYANPDGRTLKIAVSRIKATSKAGKRQGPLLSNPGGPGGPGLDLPAFLASALPKRVARTYDFIGFDPRGVGDSRPALNCRYNAYKLPQPAYEPVTGEDGAPGANERAWLRRSDKLAAACEKRHGALLEHIGSLEVVADMESLRQALGAEQINYYGFSYGTKLGQLYATAYPDRVRRMILDGNIDAADDGYESLEDSARGFQSAIEEFYRWVARRDRVYGLGTSADAVEERYDDTVARLTRKPLGKVGPADFTDVMSFSAGYSESLWPVVASAFARLVGGAKGPFRKLAAAFLAPDANATAVIVAVSCLDSRSPEDYEEWREDAFEIAAEFPFRAWANALSALPCRVWPAEGRFDPEVGGLDTPAMLLVSTTGDGVTPYSASLSLRELFPNSVLLAERGSIDHTAGLDDNKCVNKTIFAYLRSGALPERKFFSDGADKTCTSKPRPKALKEDREDAGRDGLAG